MTQEDKSLLLKDLCARLPYGVKCAPVTTNGEINTIGGYCDVFDDVFIKEVDGWFSISMIKPYLRPMSSMTEEEKSELYEIESGEFSLDEEMTLRIDFLNSHHFDYRGLIEKNLALDCTGMHIYD